MLATPSQVSESLSGQWGWPDTNTTFPEELFSRSVFHKRSLMKVTVSALPRSATRQGTGNGWGPPGSRSPWAHRPGGGWRAYQGTSQVPRPAEKGPVEAGPNISIAVSSHMACDQDPGRHWAQTPEMASTSTVTPHFRHVRPVSGLCQLLLLLMMEMKKPRIAETLLTWPTSWS